MAHSPGHACAGTRADVIQGCCLGAYQERSHLWERTLSASQSSSTSRQATFQPATRLLQYQEVICGATSTRSGRDADTLSCRQKSKAI